MQFSFVGAKIIKSIERWKTFWEKMRFLRQICCLNKNRHLIINGLKSRCNIGKTQMLQN